MFGASKQAYYKHGDGGLEKAAKIRFIVEYVKDIRLMDKGIGGEKLWYMYKEYFGSRYSLGRDAFTTILRQYDLTLRKPRKSCRTTNSAHDFPLYPNLISNLEIVRSNQVWVSDITYVRLLNGFCFLSLVTDAYDHQIIGAYVGPTLETVYTLKALGQAYQKLPAEGLTDLIHHSDRGVQYASFMYTDELKKHGIKISMTQNGDPKENAVAERVNGILKYEFLNYYEFETIDEVRQAVCQAVDFYNTRRPHRSLDMLTPEQASKRTGPLRKHWISYKDKYTQTSQ